MNIYHSKTATKPYTLAATLAFLGIIFCPLGFAEDTIESFEKSSSFTLNQSIHGIDGWKVLQGAATITKTESAKGKRSVLIEASNPEAVLTYKLNKFKTKANKPFAETSFFLKISAPEQDGTYRLFDARGASIAFERSGNTGRILALNGNDWQDASHVIPLIADEEHLEWMKFSVFESVNSDDLHYWAFAIDDTLFANDLAYEAGSPVERKLTIYGDINAPIYLDKIVEKRRKKLPKTIGITAPTPISPGAAPTLGIDFLNTNITDIPELVANAPLPETDFSSPVSFALSAASTSNFQDPFTFPTGVVTLGTETFGNCFPSAVLVTSEPPQNGLQLWEDPVFGRFWADNTIDVTVTGGMNIVHEVLGELESLVDDFDTNGIWFKSSNDDFGWFKTSAASYPWIYHLEHRWISVGSGDWPNGLWFWDLELDWLFTSNTLYPSFWSDTSQVWLAYALGTKDPRWFYSFATSTWMAVGSNNSSSWNINLTSGNGTSGVEGQSGEAGNFASAPLQVRVMNGVIPVRDTAVLFEVINGQFGAGLATVNAGAGVPASGTSTVQSITLYTDSNGYANLSSVGSTQALDVYFKLPSVGGLETEIQVTVNGNTDSFTIRSYESFAQLSAPTFALSSNTNSNPYLGAQNLVINNPNSSGVIHYTVDGSEPTSRSPIYTFDDSLPVSSENEPFVMDNGIYQIRARIFPENSFYTASMDSSALYYVKPFASPSSEIYYGPLSAQNNITGYTTNSGAISGDRLALGLGWLGSQFYDIPTFDRTSDFRDVYEVYRQIGYTVPLTYDVNGSLSGFASNEKLFQGIGRIDHDGNVFYIEPDLNAPSQRLYHGVKQLGNELGGTTLRRLGYSVSDFPSNSFLTLSEGWITDVHPDTDFIVDIDKPALPIWFGQKHVPGDNFGPNPFYRVHVTTNPDELDTTKRHLIGDGWITFFNWGLPVSKVQLENPQVNAENYLVHLDWQTVFNELNVVIAGSIPSNMSGRPNIALGAGTMLSHHDFIPASGTMPQTVYQGLNNAMFLNGALSYQSSDLSNAVNVGQGWIYMENRVMKFLPVGDFDGDSIDNLTELANGLDWQNVDSDGDTLPDALEFYNASLDATMWNDPSADEDGDGANTLLEAIYGTDVLNANTDGDAYGDYEEMLLGISPTDASNGTNEHYLLAVGGQVQDAEIGQYAPQPLALQLKDRDGNPIANADVTFTVEDNSGGLTQVQDINGTHINTLTVATNEGGLISGQTNPVYFRATSSVPTTTIITATYENQSVSFTINSSATPPAPPTDMPVPPDNLVSQDNGDGTFSLSWTDNSSNENGFYIYRQNTDGIWDAIGFVGQGITFFKDTTFQAAAPGETPNYQAGAVVEGGAEMISGQSNADTPFQFALIDLGAGRNPSRVADNGWVLSGNERWKWGTWETLTNANSLSDMNASGVVVGNINNGSNSTRPALWSATSTSPSTWPNITPADGPTNGNALVIGDNGEVYGNRTTWENVSTNVVTNTTFHFKSNGSSSWGTTLSNSFTTSNLSTGETTASGGTDTRIIDINASGSYVFSRVVGGGQIQYYSNVLGNEKLLNYEPKAINNQNVIAGVNASGEQYIIDEGSGNMQLLTPTSGMASNISLSSDDAEDYTVVAGSDIWIRLLTGNGQLQTGFSRFSLNDFVPSSTGWTNVKASHISASGLITGSGNLNGTQHGFIALDLNLAGHEPAKVTDSDGNLARGKRVLEENETNPDNLVFVVNDDNEWLFPFSSSNYPEDKNRSNVNASDNDFVAVTLKFPTSIKTGTLELSANIDSQDPEIALYKLTLQGMAPIQKQAISLNPATVVDLSANNSTHLLSELLTNGTQTLYVEGLSGKADLNLMLKLKVNGNEVARDELHMKLFDSVHHNLAFAIYPSVSVTRIAQHINNSDNALRRDDDGIQGTEDRTTPVSFRQSDEPRTSGVEGSWADVDRNDSNKKNEIYAFLLATSQNVYVCDNYIGAAGEARPGQGIMIIGSASSLTTPASVLAHEWLHAFKNHDHVNQTNNIMWGTCPPPPGVPDNGSGCAHTHDLVDRGTSDYVTKTQFNLFTQ